MLSRTILMAAAMATVTAMTTAAVTIKPAVPKQQVVGEDNLTLFFSPAASPDAKAIEEILAAARVTTVRVHWALLIEEFRQLVAKPGSDFAVAVEAIRRVHGESFAGLALYDPEGLSKAKSLGIKRLPALVLERRGQIHIAYGRNPDVEGIIACSR